MNIKFESNFAGTALIGIICATIGSVVISGNKERNKRKIRKDELDAYASMDYAEKYEKELIQKLDAFERTMEE